MTGGGGFVPLRDRVFRAALRRSLAGCSTVLDVGCGSTSLLQRAGFRGRAIGMERSPHELAIARRAGSHWAWVRGDARDVARVFRPRSVDAVVALDVVEHLPREAAERLLDDLERVARGRVVVFTPNGFVAQPATPENPFQEHLCGFSVDDMRGRGYAVRGMYGLRVLFGPLGEVTARPRVLFRRLADLSALLVLRAPRLAFSLLCTKDVG